MPQTARRATRRSVVPARSSRGRARPEQPALPFPGAERAEVPPVRRGEQSSRQRRHLARWLFSLLTAILIANALIGERGLPATLRIRREHRELAGTIAALQETNQRLHREAERLRDDPAAIEELARRDLGLIRPGERLFIVTDRSAPLPVEHELAHRTVPNDAQNEGLPVFD